ncbi:MAG: SGNH/GDSL hydrolase family protein [Candidatus Cloacimonetes bacterium]|nr:SGNH/GDSL hydrolase family protein [Candidatus Cloacimonadota bacterium]
MKYSFKLFGCILTILSLALIGCEDRTELTAPQTPSTGDADFSCFVTLGNSLTAGYQNNSLYGSAQECSFGNLIAQQVWTDYEQPLFDDTGTSGKMSLITIDPLIINYSTESGNPVNLNYPASYNNLGIPGAFLWDVLNATDSTDCYTAQLGYPNALFDVILRNSALGLGSQFQQAKVLNPTFILLWIGNNDILMHATSGGIDPYTPKPFFETWYGELADSLATLNADVVVANIPDVGAIPYFTTIGHPLGDGLKQAMAIPGVVGLFYQKHGETVASSFADTLALWNNTILITLPGATYAPLLGQSTGQYYRDNDISPIPAGIDTTQVFGLHPQNPWPDALVLDEDEIATIVDVTNSYNNTISDLATANDFVLVDIYTFFNEIAASVYSADGLDFTTEYIKGGLFSLDGVHPTSRGYAIVANKFIETINAEFDAEIPYIYIPTIPGSIPLAGGI